MNITTCICKKNTMKINANTDNNYMCTIAIIRREMIFIFDQILIYFVGIYFQRIL